MKSTPSIKKFRQQALNAWNRLSKEEKKYLDKNQTIKVVAHQLEDLNSLPREKRKSVFQNLTLKGSLAFNIIKSSVRARSRMDKTLTKRDLFKRFREEYPSLYAKYNSYIYRQGLSSANYFYHNVELEYSGKSNIDAYLDLPGRRYQILEISFNYSSKDFFASMY